MNSAGLPAWAASDCVVLAIAMTSVRKMTEAKRRMIGSSYRLRAFRCTGTPFLSSSYNPCRAATSCGSGPDGVLCRTGFRSAASKALQHRGQDENDRQSHDHEAKIGRAHV